MLPDGLVECRGCGKPVRGLGGGVCDDCFAGGRLSAPVAAPGGGEVAELHALANRAVDALSLLLAYKADNGYSDDGEMDLSLDGERALDALHDWLEAHPTPAPNAAGDAEGGEER
jgi:hypothetical protein